MIGCPCQRQILTEYIQYGLLPYPKDGLWFALHDVERVIAGFEARRKKAGMTERPSKP